MGRIIGKEWGAVLECHLSSGGARNVHGTTMRAGMLVGDMVAEAFGLPNPFGLRHALARDGDAANCRLDNVTYDPGEVAGKEGEWRPVPGYEGRYLLGTCGTFLKIETDICPFEEGLCPNDSPFRSHKALVPESGPRVAKSTSPGRPARLPSGRRSPRNGRFCPREAGATS